ncbi:MAG: sigma-70 family RNA polymerase sigma factor [Actinomycetota bacterium]
MQDEAIYTKVKDDLIRYAAVIAGPDRAEDVVSSVMVRLLTKRPLSSLDDPRPYLFRAVLNESRGALRRERRAPLPTQASAQSIPEPDWEVLQAVSMLPARQRAAVFLRYWEDLPVADVADLMGTRVGTVKRYLHLARKSLEGVLA